MDLDLEDVQAPLCADDLPVEAHESGVRDARQPTRDAHRLQDGEPRAEGIFARALDPSKDVEGPELDDLHRGRGHLDEADAAFQALADLLSELVRPRAGGRHLADQRERDRSGRSDEKFAAQGDPFMHGLLSGSPFDDLDPDLVLHAEPVLVGPRSGVRQ
jgi:hypothetical protein